MGKTIDAHEAARILDLKYHTVLKYASNGKLRSIKYGDTMNAPVRFDMDDVINYRNKFTREAI